MIPSASRSLTDPIGLKASIFTYRLTCGGASLLIRTTGVLPMVPRMLSNLRPMVEPPPLSVEPASLRRLPFRPEIHPAGQKYAVLNLEAIEKESSASLSRPLGRRRTQDFRDFI